MKRALILAATVFLSFVERAEAADTLPKRGVFVYSSLCAHQESGDVLGMRITVARYPEATYA